MGLSSKDKFIKGKSFKYFNSSKLKIRFYLKIKVFKFFKFLK